MIKISITKIEEEARIEGFDVSIVNNSVPGRIKKFKERKDGSSKTGYVNSEYIPPDGYKLYYLGTDGTIERDWSYYMLVSPDGKKIYIELDEGVTSSAFISRVSEEYAKKQLKKIGILLQ